MRRTIITAIGLSLLSWAMAPVAAVPATYHGVRYLMGTWCDLTLFDVSAEKASAAAEAAFQEIARLERVMSTWDPDTELTGVNRAAGSRVQSISRDLADVLAAALDTCRDSDGAFDPTVGPLLTLWRFDTERPTLPTPKAVAEARSRVGCGKVLLRREPPTLELPEKFSLDLGGIGKGYAVDRALEVLHTFGVHRAKLDFGSSSLAFEGHVDGGWPVVVADPGNRDRPLLTFRVDRGAVSSSGQREHSFVQNGRRYGHLFDPRAGRPVQSALLLVTVVAPDSVQADAWSTALFVMGADAGARFVARMPGLSAIFVEARPGQRLSVRTVGRIEGLMRLSPKIKSD